MLIKIEIGCISTVYYRIIFLFSEEEKRLIGMRMNLPYFQETKMGEAGGGLDF
jgi:hypothetical protein